MKRIIHLLIFLTVFLSIVFVRPVQASTIVKSLAAQTNQLPSTFKLSQLGYSDTLMIGPYDSTSVFFSLPANVKLAPGSSLSLKYALAWSGGGVSNGSELTGFGGTLLVYFNDELVDTVILSSDSSLEMEIPISDSALNKPDENGRYSLKFFLNADVNCEFDSVRTTMIISKNSQLNFQYDVTVPPADLIGRQCPPHAIALTFCGSGFSRDAHHFAYNIAAKAAPTNSVATHPAMPLQHVR